MRGEKPFIFSNLKTGQGLSEIADFIARHRMLQQCRSHFEEGGMIRAAPGPSSGRGS
jgi:hypothetical protein